MLDLRQEIVSLKGKGDWLIPSTALFDKAAYTSVLRGADDFWDALVMNPIKIPSKCLLSMMNHALSCIQNILLAVGQLFSLHFNNILENLGDAGKHFALSVVLAVSAILQCMLRSIQFLTRLISTWSHVLTRANEPEDRLEYPSVVAHCKKQSKFLLEHEILPSSTFISKSSFFSPYKNGTEFVQGVTDIVGQPIGCAALAIGCTVHALLRAVQGIVDLLICHPQHAGANFREMTADLSIAIALAIMTPIHALANAARVITRVGSTLNSSICMTQSTEAPSAKLD